MILTEALTAISDNIPRSMQTATANYSSPMPRSLTDTSHSHPRSALTRLSPWRGHDLCPVQRRAGWVDRTTSGSTARGRSVRPCHPSQRPCPVQSSGVTAEQISFESRCGNLRVRRQQETLELDFPAHPPVACRTPDAISKAFAQSPHEWLAAENYIVVFDSEACVTIESYADAVRCTPSPELRHEGPHLYLLHDPVASMSVTESIAIVLQGLFGRDSK